MDKLGAEVAAADPHGDDVGQVLPRGPPQLAAPHPLREVLDLVEGVVDLHAHERQQGGHFNKVRLRHGWWVGLKTSAREGFVSDASWSRSRWR